MKFVARFAGLWCRDGASSLSMGPQMSISRLFILTQVRRHELPNILHFYASPQTTCARQSSRTPILSLSTLPSPRKCPPRCHLVFATQKRSWRLASIFIRYSLLRSTTGATLFWPNGRRGRKRSERPTRRSSSPMRKGPIHLLPHSQLARVRFSGGWLSKGPSMEGFWR